MSTLPFSEVFLFLFLPPGLDVHWGHAGLSGERTTGAESPRGGAEPAEAGEVLMRAMDNVDSRLIFPWKLDVVCNKGSPRIA